MTAERGGMAAMVTITEAAVMLGKTQATVRRWIHSGRLPAVRLQTGKQPPFVIKRRDVEKLRLWLIAEANARKQPPIRLPSQAPPLAPLPQLTSPDDPRLVTPESVRIRHEANLLLEQFKQQEVSS